jgi:hypothetical protein
MVASPTSSYTRALGLVSLLWALPALGQVDEAALIADDAVRAAEGNGSPQLIALSTGTRYGGALAAIDPPRALAGLRSALDYSRQHRVVFGEIITSYQLAMIEAEYGDLHRGLDLFDFTIDSWQRAGDRFQLPAALATLALCFERLEEHEIAAIIYGSSTRFLSAGQVAGLAPALEQLRANLGAAEFDRCLAAGAAMETGDAWPTPASRSDWLATSPAARRGHLEFGVRNRSGRLPAAHAAARLFSRTSTGKGGD